MAADKIEIQQCKVQTVHHFLEKNNRYVDENIIFLLGIDEFLQFGLEKYKQQLLWFIITYNEESLNEIFKMLEIQETYLAGSSIEQIKGMVKQKQDICIYFDFESRKILQDDVKIPDKLPIRNIGKNSFGMIDCYDDSAFILNVNDLDNRRIKIPFEAYKKNNMMNHTVRLEFSNSSFIQEKELLTRVIDKLERACNIYLTEQLKYEYDEESGKYGVSGYASLIALKEEIRNLVFQAEQSGEKKYTEILKVRLNIMRLYMGKGSESAYRKEFGNALIYIIKYGIPLKACGEMFLKVGKKWRKFHRILSHINTPYYFLNIKSYFEKLSGLISEICSEEFEAVTELKNQIYIYKNSSIKK